MPDVKTDPDSLHAAADELRSESKRLGSILAGLEQEAAGLRERWDGGARDAYDRAQRQWSSTLDEMTTLLTKIATATDGIADRFVHADDHSATLFTSSGNASGSV